MEKRPDTRVVCIKMDTSSSPHFYIENNNAYISQDLTQTVDFLIGVESEIKTILGFKEKIKDLYEHYKDLLKCTSEMARLLKDDGQKFEYKFKDRPEAIIEKSKLEIPIRSELIILFASLEVLYFLDLTYKNETINDSTLRTLAMDNKNLKKFLNSFVLNKNNEFYNKHIIRFSKVHSKMLRELRNSLTHFFSVNAENLFIVQDHESDKVKKIESLFNKNKMGNVVSMSPDDLAGLIEGAHKVIFKIWDKDCRNDIKDFQKKIQFVIELVKTKGPYLIKEDSINL